ncbi:hypothetical protein CHARACLAT_009213 [Characodon lateralis]|uniref:Uncharacterized protein n=1 Tax=Characodon lateralis TaxID=208331 RepID=A0ABU7CZT4_9TELE|nr:hypothetical protein [Characodon lateralis]
MYGLICRRGQNMPSHSKKLFAERSDMMAMLMDSNPKRQSVKFQIKGMPIHPSIVCLSLQGHRVPGAYLHAGYTLDTSPVHHRACPLMQQNYFTFFNFYFCPYKVFVYFLQLNNLSWSPLFYNTKKTF